jgi:hypothetical protein
MPAEATMRALRHVWLALKPLDIPMAVMGGLALAAWKYVRATKDVDLLLGIAGDEPGPLLETLQAAGIRPRQLPIIRLGQLELIRTFYEPPEAFVDIEIDLLLAKSDYHRQALARRVPMQLAGLDVEIAVLSCEDLILHKLLAERMIDRVDIGALLQANRNSLDLSYLLQCARKLGHSPVLAEAWASVWPGESLPE